jgi:adenylate cyclase
MKSPVICTGAALTAACLALYVYEPPLVTEISSAAFDALIKRCHRPQATNCVAIVDIDEASLARHGQWPWPRYLMAELTRKIFDAGASVIAFDILFAEPDRTSPHSLSREWASFFRVQADLDFLPPDVRDFDSLLAGALHAGPTVLSCYMQPLPPGTEPPAPAEDPHYRGYFYTKGPGLLSRHLPQARDATLAIPELSAAAGNNAFFNTVPDRDSVVRHAPLVWACGPSRIYPSLALESVRLHLGVAQVGIEYSEGGIEGVRIQDRLIPTDEQGRLLVNYRSGDFLAYPAASLLDGTWPGGELAGKIVFIGTSAPGLRDLRATPLTADYAGVGIQATIVENILSRDFLRMPRWMHGFDAAAILGMGIFLTVVIHRQRSWLSFAVALTAVAACVAASVHMLRSANLVFVPSRVILSILVLYPVLSMVSFWQHELHTRWIRNTFGAMVSSDVLRYLEKNPEGAATVGHKAEATVMFSDVAGFSSIAEKMEPGQLCELMNSYLSPMAQVVMDRQGYVDKYVGDMIMAEWGVPFPIRNHAEQACLAALEQREILSRLQPLFRQRYGISLNSRTGINTGPVTAGNMGSSRRYQYTVMGDAVNLASRLEPLNKEYGTNIIIGAATRAQAGSRFVTRQLDRVKVAGRSEEETIYELVGLKGKVPPAKLEAIRLYEDALRLHALGEFVEPVENLKNVLRLDRHDHAALHLLQRITSMKISVESILDETPAAETVAV